MLTFMTNPIIGILQYDKADWGSIDPCMNDDSFGGKHWPHAKIIWPTCAVISINESCDWGIVSPQSWRKSVYSWRVGESVNPVKSIDLHQKDIRYWGELKGQTNLKWASSWENLFMPYANNKGADQPEHPRSLISTFVVRCLDSIISLVSISGISSI